MNWFGAEINDPMVVTRAIHFAATAMTAGILMFRGFVSEPALRWLPETSAHVQSRIARLAWAGLGIAVVTGLVWLALQTMSITGLRFGEAITSGAIWTVLDETQFGLLSQIRLALAILLAACLAFGKLAVSRWLALLAATGLVMAIAWTGHAGSTAGQLGYLHVTADALHLAAASAWLGGLAGLLLLFKAGRSDSAFAWSKPQLVAIRRFSRLGMISVATLILTGIINTRILVGSPHALLTTDYGRLLMFKLFLFAVMVAFATVNRFRLTPRLPQASESDASRKARSALGRNTLIEAVLALAIFAIVGVLGTLHPAMHLM